MCLPAAVVVGAMAYAQFTGPLRIGMITFFGYEGQDPEPVRAALPFKVGDSIPPDRLGDVSPDTILREYGVGIDTHKRFIQVSVFIREKDNSPAGGGQA